MGVMHSGMQMSVYMDVCTPSQLETHRLGSAACIVGFDSLLFSGLLGSLGGVVGLDRGSLSLIFGLDCQLLYRHLKIARF